MQYRDKSTGRVVNLRESASDFLALTRPAESETLGTLLNQRVFAVTRSSNADQVVIFRAKVDAESAVEIAQELERIRARDEVVDVVPALVDSSGATRFALPGRVTVQFKGATQRQAERVLTALGSGVVRRFRSPGLFEVSLPPGSTVPELIGALNRSDLVAFAEPTFYGVDDLEPSFSAARTGPADGESPDEATPDAGVDLEAPAVPWNLRLIRVPQAWRYTRGRPDIVVCVVDGLPETEHEALRDKLFAPLDAGLMFTADESLSSHATNVCSIIAGESAQMIGAAPDVRLVPVVVNLRSQVYAERADAIRKVAQIAREGLGGNRCARVVCSCSWRTSGDIAVMRSAIEEAIAADVFMVFSAGNENSDAPHFPSDYGTSGAAADGIVGVAATTQDDTKASYSSFSRNVSLAAPGGDGLPLDERDIVCADQGGTYVAAAGTSIAAPHVAAVAALMLSVRPDLSLGALKRALLESCDSIDLANPAYRGKLGAGRVNAERAVEAVLAPEDAMNGERMAPETIVPPLLGFRLGSPAVATPVDETAGGFIPELGGELELGSGWRVAALVLTKAGDVRVVAPSGGAR